jgi:hypothetical protein
MYILSRCKTVEWEVFQKLLHACLNILRMPIRVWTIVCRLVKIYKTIILPAVWYGCEKWCLTLKEEHCLGVLLHPVV